MIGLLALVDWSDPFTWIWVVLIVVLFFTLLTLLIRAEEKRKRDLKEWIGQHDANASWEDDFETFRAWPEVPEFKYGFDRKLTFWVSGKYRGWDFFAFDFEYKVETTNSEGKTRKSTRYVNGILIRLEKGLGGSLRLNREGKLHRIAAIVGYQDIDFESDQFSRRFDVQADPRKFAYDLIHPQAMEYLLGFEKPWSLEVRDTYVWIPQPISMGWKAEQLESMLSYASGFLDLVPEYLMNSSPTDSGDMP